MLHLVLHLKRNILTDRADNTYQFIKCFYDCLTFVHRRFN